MTSENSSLHGKNPFLIGNQEKVMSIKIYKQGSKGFEKCLSRLKSRFTGIPKKIEAQVKRIGERVKKEGDQALIEFTEKFDKVRLSLDELRVTEEEIKRAYEEVDSELISAIKLAIKKVEDFHKKTLPSSWFDAKEGIIYGQKVTPVDSVGLYIPGGKGGETPLISTVVMTAIPASIAGVERIVMVSPPRKDKTLHPALIVAGKECGVKEIYKVGGPWSIFALAYGTQSIKKVDLICGPGNIYVTTAKKLVSAFTGIDIIAGPSEVVVIADESANPEFICWDLLAQAEHDPMSLPILITTSYKLAKKVKNLIEEALKQDWVRSAAKESITKQGAILVVGDLEIAIELANKVAPEHLELAIKEPMLWLSKVRHAGAVFLGEWTPETVGDYAGGPNHVLPTMGFARFCSSLSVEKFCKKVNFLCYSEEALLREGSQIIKLAEAENLFCHAQAVKIRIKYLHS